MLTAATSLTACRKTPSELRQQLRHQLGALGRRRDRIAEEVPAAGEQRADGRGVRALHRRAARSRGSGSQTSGTVGCGGGHARLDALCAGVSRARAAARRARGRRRSTARSPCRRRGRARRGRGPCAASIAWPGSMQPCAQASMQRPQPLQYSGARNGRAFECGGIAFLLRLEVQDARQPGRPTPPGRRRRGAGAARGARRPAGAPAGDRPRRVP